MNYQKDYEGRPSSFSEAPFYFRMLIDLYLLFLGELK